VGVLSWRTTHNARCSLLSVPKRGSDLSRWVGDYAHVVSVYGEAASAADPRHDPARMRAEQFKPSQGNNGCATRLLRQCIKQPPWRGLHAQLPDVRSWDRRGT
jgi:hypothetical protein